MHNDYKHSSLIRLILAEKWLTITVIGSVVTFQFISSFKTYIVDPLLEYIFPNDKFHFMDITIRDGVELTPPNPKLIVRFGEIIKEGIKWIVVLFVLFLVSKYTNFPDLPAGNATGAAVM